jgi:hypothetical protein
MIFIFHRGANPKNFKITLARITITAVAGPFVMMRSGYSKGVIVDVLAASYKAVKHPIKQLKDDRGVVYKG